MSQKPLHMLIQQLRNQRGLSQSRVAHDLAMSRPTYIQIEKGKREPTVSDLKNLANVFGVSTALLLSGESGGSFNVSFSEVKESPVPTKPDIRIHVPQKNLKKFKEVLLYILQKVGAKPNVGETVLYKLLYFIDFDFYEKYERQLIGATYIKNHHGPTPVEFKKIVEDMKRKGEIDIVRSKYFQYEQKKYLPVRPPDLTAFSAEEKQLIDDVLLRLSDKNAKDLSEYSHADVPWRVHKMGEPISYETVFYRGHEHSVKNYSDEL